MTQPASSGPFVALTAVIARHRALVATLLVIATAVMGAGIPRMTVDMSTESFFLEDDPVKQTYREFREYFGSDEFIFIVYRAKDGDVFSEASLDALNRFHRELRDAVEMHQDAPGHPLNRITDVTSLVNVGYLEADAESLRSRDFIADRPPETAADRAALRKAAMAHPTYTPSLLNRQGNFAVIILDTDLGARVAGALDADIEFFLEAHTDGAAPAVETTFVRPTLWDYKHLTDAVQAVIDASPTRNALAFHPVGNPVIMKFFADVFTLVILPMTITPQIADVKQRRHPLQRLLRRMAPLATARPRTVSLLFFVLSGVFFYGLCQIRVDTNMAQIISPRHPIRHHIDTVEAHVGGTMDMEILVSSKQSDALKDPRLMTAMAALQDYLETAFPDLVVSTYALPDAVKESFQALNENRPEMYRIPETRPMLAQTLLLFEGAAPDDQAKLVTGDYANARISVRIRNQGSHTYIPFMSAVQDRIAALASPLKTDYPGLEMRITGVFALTMKLADFVSWSQIKSFSLALGVISVLFINGVFRTDTHWVKSRLRSSAKPITMPIP